MVHIMLWLKLQFKARINPKSRNQCNIFSVLGQEIKTKTTQ